MKLKDIVCEILEEYEVARNSDIALTSLVWQRVRPDLIIQVNGVKGITLRSLLELPREDGIKRVRAHIQNDLRLFLPTDENVMRKRFDREKNWRNEVLESEEYNT